MEMPYPRHCTTIMWTFNTTMTSSTHQTIRITFRQFDFERDREFLVIGDGMIGGRSTELARFTGSHPRTAVEFLSNAIWIMIQTDFDRCCRAPAFELSVVGVDKSGTGTQPYSLI